MPGGCVRPGGCAGSLAGGEEEGDWRIVVAVVPARKGLASSVTATMSSKRYLHSEVMG
jgi:hypothetical protein